ncbi:uncharacterized protein LY89DRAFT_736571 [Mollisia scopiformis]|uniref:Clr5 domain-containing protein n=1 Tax=Mollisia scopiformis TaxID=149040 RepID=A0A194X2X7_MOLSC|nr:uncharacterized protein LY89DRAFT_736571 [Mollisia scopiformis]KUJ14540.1 hypothetical protein LY89DRAFT_736571 [Mollisia scopiformis]
MSSQSALDNTLTFVPVDYTTVAGQAKAARASKAGPSNDDWERHRPLIRRLYVDEKKKLKEVATIMAQQGHNATTKMYKDRITKWKLDKKHKEADMLAILRKKAQRERIGKETRIRVRGQLLTMQQVHDYFKRKKNTRAPALYDAPTPSDVSCRTPSPAPTGSLKGRENQMTTQIQANVNNNSVTEIFVPPNAMDVATDIDWAHTENIPIQVSAEDEAIMEWTLHIMRSIASESTIPPFPSAPQALLVSERIFLTIKTYVDGCFEKGIWITDVNGFLVSRSDEILKPGDLYTYCSASLELLENGSVVEFRRMLSKAFATLDALTRFEHPRTLNSLLDVFFTLRRAGRAEIVELFRKFVFELVIELHGKQHPWVPLFRLIGMVEEELLGETITQSWTSVIGLFERILGPDHPFSIDVNFDYINRTLEGLQGMAEAEKRLRRLLTRVEEVEDVSDPRTVAIIIDLGWNLLRQRRDAEAEDLGMNVMARIEEHHVSGGAHALELVASSQYYQEKSSPAERNQRNLIQLIADAWGTSDPWAIQNMMVLERWLREWGDHDKAEALKKQITEAIGQDEIDEQTTKF